MSKCHKIAIVGTGFIAKGLARLITGHHPDLAICAVLTRRKTVSAADFPVSEQLTNSISQLVDQSDLIVECSGDPIHATDVVNAAFEAGIPVVTMASEFHVTTGSYFAGKGYLTEAEGDQPGCLAALHEDIVQMGFQPLVYGNMKGYLNHTPTVADMTFWAEKQGFSLDQTTSFTDGTKLQIEQALVANGLGATISKQGMEGLEHEDITTAAKELGDVAAGIGRPIADFVVSPGQAPGVFITASHDETEWGPLANIKMGEGPHYVLMRNYHLCALEIVKTIRRTLSGSKVLLNNSIDPEIGVATIAKINLKPGTAIKRGIGGFEVRGEAICVADNPNHLPIGLMQNAIIEREIEPGQILTWDDVMLPDSLAVDIARNLFTNFNGNTDT